MSPDRGSPRCPRRARAVQRLCAFVPPLLLLLAFASLADAQPTDALNDTTCPPLLPQPFPSPRPRQQDPEGNLLQQPPQRQQDGQSVREPLQPASRLVGGQLSAALPFLASLHTNAGGYHCTAVVLNRRALLTAARCAPLLDAPAAFARVNGFIRTEGAFFPIESVIPHPSYAGKPGLFDAALVRLRNPIPSPSTVPLASERDSPPPGAAARVVAHGPAPDAPNRDRGRPRVLDLVGVPCFNGAMCYGRGEKGCRTCERDAGSPLIAFTRTQPVRPVLVAIVSNSSRSCTGARTEGADEPAFVYATRAATLVSWLRDQGVDFGAVIGADIANVTGADGPSKAAIDAAGASAAGEGDDGEGDDDEGGWSPGLIAVVVIVCVLAVIGIPLLAWFAWRASGMQQVRAIEREGAELAGSGVMGGSTEASISRRNTDGL